MQSIEYMMQKNLRVILGDQISESISALKDAQPSHDDILMAEVKEEATYVPHHPQKIILIFSAMRHFAEQLRKKGFTVYYKTINDPTNLHSLKSEIKQQLDSKPYSSVIMTEPAEYRLLSQIQKWAKNLSADIEMRPDDRFLCSKGEFITWSKTKSSLLMESFYREMRKKTGYLIEAGKPVGGKWNFDSENRKSLKKSSKLRHPVRFKCDKITLEVIKDVKRNFPNHFGSADNFQYAVTRKDALKALDDFIEHSLMLFGDYQDAMVNNEPFVYHSILSPYINIGLLSPREVCDAVESAYKDGKAPLNAAEGFIRQIIGWREYIRGIYWLKMPHYVNSNGLNAKKPLPNFYWGEASGMACIDACVKSTYEHAYSHHIQRLMVTGNFALLAGIDPMAVHEWYLAVYCDAYEWVELPNTIGMALHADGGVLATKPYAASGAYINRMSNFCSDCQYSVKEKVGDSACPFNYLYWNFMLTHQKRFKNNPRMGFVYRNLDKMDAEQIKQIKESAKKFLGTI